MSNQSRPQGGTAGSSRSRGRSDGNGNGNSNDTNPYVAQYMPGSSMMHAGGNRIYPPNSHHHSSTAFATGGATGIVPEPPYARLQGYGDPGPAILAAIMARQSSQHSESWNPFYAVQQHQTAEHGHQHPPMSPANIQVPGYQDLFPLGNSASPSQLSGNSSRSTQCEVCGNTLGTPRERLRHMRTVHSTAWYICKCVHSNARKDNYLRHLRSCQLRHNTGLFFFCICGKDDSNLEDHLAHVNGCRQRR